MKLNRKFSKNEKYISEKHNFLILNIINHQINKIKSTLDFIILQSKCLSLKKWWQMYEWLWESGDIHWQYMCDCGNQEVFVHNTYVTVEIRRHSLTMHVWLWESGGIHLWWHEHRCIHYGNQCEFLQNTRAEIFHDLHFHLPVNCVYVCVLVCVCINIYILP